MTPLDLCDDLVRRARAAGAEQAEACFGDHTIATIEVRDQAVESLVSATQRGVGLRALVGGATGYAYTTDLAAAALDENRIGPYCGQTVGFISSMYSWRRFFPAGSTVFRNVTYCWTVVSSSAIPYV